MTTSDHERKITHQISILLVMMIIISALTAVVSVAAAWVSIQRTVTSTVTIQQDYEYSVPITVCANDAFTVTYRVRTTKVPSVVQIYDNWYSLELGHNIWLETMPMYSIVSHQEDFTRTIQLHVPDLLPGNYEYVRAAQEDGSPISTMNIPVNVVECDPW